LSTRTSYHAPAAASIVMIVAGHEGRGSNVPSVATFHNSHGLFITLDLMHWISRIGSWIHM